MKKIAIFIPSLKGGGAERVFVTLATCFIENGFEVEFILLDTTGGFRFNLSEEMPVHDLAATRIRDGLFPLIAYLKKSKPDVLIVAMWPLTIIGILAHYLSGNFRGGKKVLVSDHTILSLTKENNGLFQSLFLKWSIRLLYPLASKRLAVSKGVAKDIVKLAGLNQGCDVQVIYNPVEISGNSEILEKKSSRYRVITVGSFKPAKDHKTLILAFNKIAKKIDAELVILGEGPMHQELMDLIESLGLSKRISLPGFKTDLLNWYSSSDLFVLSSRYEGFGNVLVEAMSCGVPVVSTVCPSGPAEILENGKYGKLVPVGDIDALAEAMLQSLQEEHDVEALKARASDFNVDKIARQYLELMFPEMEIHP